MEHELVNIFCLPVKKVLIIIPAFNEAATIESLIREIQSTDFSFLYDCVVVNDGSSDETAAIAETLGTKVLDLPYNIGIGGAVQTGFLYALEREFDYVVQVDGDGQHPPAEISNLYNEIHRKNLDMVIGSRFLGSGGFRSSVMRRKGISFLAYLLKRLSKLNVRDTTSGFRIYSRPAFSFLAAEYPDDYPEPESLLTLSLSGFQIKEIEVSMRERQGGMSSITNTGSIYYMVKVSIAMFFTFIRYKFK